nr:PREDICTED: uncharacterized protein LOC104000775 [Musa acuminata subsp. malaccensis]XP_018674599.1 PREDICTED: uncharacterized protein LOC104000775 [Musa acuminata subsp. malaccensis]
MGAKMESDAIPSYLQPDTETDLDAKLNLPAAPTSNAAAMPNRARQQTEDELGLPAVPQSFYTQLKEHCSQNGKAHIHDSHNVLHFYSRTYIYSPIRFRKDEGESYRHITVRTDGTSSASSGRRWRQADRALAEPRDPAGDSTTGRGSRRRRVPRNPPGRPALVPKLMGLEDLSALTVAVTPEAAGAAAGSGEVRRGPQDPEADHRGRPLGGDPR